MLAASLTAAGALAGTPAYMSPEQYRGDPLDSRTDQFSFCAALYEALYRQLPFAGKELADLAGEILLGRVRPVPKESTVPPLIAEVLRRGMALDPAQRFPSMEELLSALLIDPRHDPAGAPRPRRLFTVAVFLALVVLAWNRAVRRREERRARKDPSPPGPSGSRPGSTSGE